MGNLLISLVGFGLKRDATVIDREECCILAAVDRCSIAWTGFQLEVEHPVKAVIWFASGVWVGYFIVFLSFFMFCSM
jgi:hypothetical protein